jgi:hypothetical protein
MGRHLFSRHEFADRHRDDERDDLVTTGLLAEELDFGSHFIA